MQHDNAQRVHETSYGLPLPTYTFEDGELGRAIDSLLGDTGLKSRMQAASARLRARPGTRRAADLLEEIAAG